MAPTPTRSERFVAWQLGVAALAIAVGIFYALRAGNDFNLWVLTSMWFAVGIFWVVLWWRTVRRRRRSADEPR